MPARSATRIVVLALLRDDKVLLLRRGASAAWMPGVWHVAGGKVELGESIEEAAVREIAEEHGVRVAMENLEFRGVVTYDYDKTDGDDADVFCFATRRWQGEPRIMEPHKHDAIKWVAKNELPDNITANCRVLFGGNGGNAYVHLIDGEVMTVIK